MFLLVLHRHRGDQQLRFLDSLALNAFAQYEAAGADQASYQFVESELLAGGNCVLALGVLDVDHRASCNQADGMLDCVVALDAAADGILDTHLDRAELALGGEPQPVVHGLDTRSLLVLGLWV